MVLESWWTNTFNVDNDGTIATQVRANTEAGFSIVTASVNQASGSLGHGLGATPDMILSKSRTVAYDWNVMNRELGGDEIYHRLTQMPPNKLVQITLIVSTACWDV